MSDELLMPWGRKYQGRPISKVSASYARWALSTPNPPVGWVRRALEQIAAGQPVHLEPAVRPPARKLSTGGLDCGVPVKKRYRPHPPDIVLE
jgi:hypothetical protein